MRKQQKSPKIIWVTPMITASFIFNELKKFNSFDATYHKGSNPTDLMIRFIFNQIISKTYGVDTIRNRNHLVASGLLVLPAGAKKVPWHGKEVVVDETAIEREEPHQK